jgi:hypothetical protein
VKQPVFTRSSHIAHRFFIAINQILQGLFRFTGNPILPGAFLVFAGS